MSRCRACCLCCILVILTLFSISWFPGASLHVHFIQYIWVSSSWSGLICWSFQFVQRRQVKWQKQARAMLHHQHRTLSRALAHWKVCFYRRFWLQRIKSLSHRTISTRKLLMYPYTGVPMNPSFFIGYSVPLPVFLVHASLCIEALHCMRKY